MLQATAKVVEWSNDVLKLTNINGNFVSSQPIYSINSNSNYFFSSYNLSGKLAEKYVEIDVTSDPPDANANSLYTYTTTITEGDWNI
jgi:hypothetical protein